MENHHSLPASPAAATPSAAVTTTNLVQESTFCTIMIWSTFYPNPISLKMMSRKFHASSSMAYLHKCPLNYTLPYGRSNFQSDFFAFLIADSDSLQKTAWRNYLSFSNIPKGSGSNKTKIERDSRGIKAASFWAAKKSLWKFDLP